MKKYLLPFIAVVIITSWHIPATVKNTDADKQDILNIEREFADFVQKEGIEAGFYKYAAEDAVANRNGNLIKGREKINEFYKRTRGKKDKLDWTAEFADVSTSGDLGYTYGNYTYTAFDSTGKQTIYKGIFHTVWKKQKDGQWRFVWD